MEPNGNTDWIPACAGMTAGWIVAINEVYARDQAFRVVQTEER